jgi:hypothetical protein
VGRTSSAHTPPQALPAAMEQTKELVSAKRCKHASREQLPVLMCTCMQANLWDALKTGGDDPSSSFCPCRLHAPLSSKMNPTHVCTHEDSCPQVAAALHRRPHICLRQLSFTSSKQFFPNVNLGGGLPTCLG